MGIFDLFRGKKPENQPQDNYAHPLPGFQMAQPPKEEVIKYMTENPALEWNTEKDKWGWNIQHMSFGYLKDDKDRDRILDSYDMNELIKDNFRPKVELFKTGLEEELSVLPYRNVIDVTLSKAEQGQFAKNMTAAINVVETKTQTGAIAPTTKKRGGLMGFLGL